MMLTVRDLSFHYPSIQVLEEINLEINDHEIVALLGPNGAGKTSLIRCINGILKPAGGHVLLDDEELSSRSMKERAREIAYVAQRGEGGRITAFDAVLLGRKPYIAWDTSEEDLKITQAVMERLHLTPFALRYIDELSGGEFQKVRIARAMVQDPRVLLLDEPTSSLDLKNQIEILNLLSEITRGHRMCALMSIHDLNIALQYADRCILLKNGRIHACTTRSEITADIISEVYETPVTVYQNDGFPVVLPLTRVHKDCLKNRS